MVGGGPVAERRVLTLLDYGAKVLMISPNETDRLAQLVSEGTIETIRREYRSGDLAGAFMVFAATGDPGADSIVRSEAVERGILINVADDPESCSFIVPASFLRDGLVVGVSTSGSYPLLAAKIRDDLKEAYGKEYVEYMRILSDFRRLVFKMYGDEESRRKILARALDPSILERIKAGDGAGAREALLRAADLRLGWD